MRAHNLSFDAELDRSDLKKATQSPDSPELTVRVFRTWEDMLSLSVTWNEFLAKSSAATICLTFEWLESWWMAYKESRELFVVSICGLDGTLVGIAPFYRTNHPNHTGTRFPIRMLRFLGTGTDGTSTSLDFIIRKGYETTGVRRLLRWLAESRSEWDILDLHLMPAESPTIAVLMEQLKHCGWPHSQKEEPHLIVPLPDQYETYLSSLSKKMRSELPYEHRRLLRKFKVDVRKIQAEAELPQAIETLFRLNTSRWQARGQRGSFHNEEKRILCREIAKRFLARGWLDFWLLELNGDPAAIEYGFRYKDTYYPLWVALNTEYKTYEAGSVLRSLIIQALINEGIHFYELMNGIEPYKMRWGAEQRSYKNLLCWLPYSRGALYMKISEVRSRGKACIDSIHRRFRDYLHNFLPPWAWNSLRNTYHRIKK